MALERKVVLVHFWCEKARKHMCVTNRHDVTLAVKVAFNLNTTNQPTYVILWRGLYSLTLSQTSPGFYVSAVQVFLKTL